MFASKISGGGSATLIEKSVNANGVYNASDDEADGYEKVTVNVPTLQTEALSVAENGTYTAPVGKAYSPVNVNVPTNEWIKRDGKTHLHIDIYNDIYLTVHMMFGQTVASGNTIYWGDGTSTTPTNTSSALQSHTYAQKGKYEITIENTSGYFYFGQDSTTRGYIFQDGITNGSAQKYTHYCTILKKAELGKGWKSDYERQFTNCNNLSDVYINTKPDQTTFAGSMFLNDVGLKFFDGVAGYNGNITSVGTSAFSGTGLQAMPVFPNATAIPGNYLSAINGAGCLNEIDLWEGITSIGQQAFRYQADVCEITIPSTVTSIAASAFEMNYGVHAIHVKPITPPTLSNANAIPAANGTYNLKIYVPSASLADYQAASNWSSFASYMIGE